MANKLEKEKVSVLWLLVLIGIIIAFWLSCANSVGMKFNLEHMAFEQCSNLSSSFSPFPIYCPPPPPPAPKNPNLTTYNLPLCPVVWQNTTLYSLAVKNNIEGSISGSGHVSGSFILGFGSVYGSSSINGKIDETTYYYFYEPNGKGGMHLSKLNANEVDLYYSETDRAYKSELVYSLWGELGNPLTPIPYPTYETTSNEAAVRLSLCWTGEIVNSYGQMFSNQNYDGSKIGETRLYIPKDSVKMEFNPNIQ